MSAWTEPTTAIRDWMRDDAGLTAVVAQRTYAGGLPDSATLPAVVIHRVGGGPDEHGIDFGLYQLDCFGATAPAAATVANAVITFLLSTTDDAMSSTLRHGGSTVNTVLTSPTLDDPDVHRTIITAQIVSVTNP